MRPRRSSSRDLQAPAPRLARQALRAGAPRAPQDASTTSGKKLCEMEDDAHERWLALTSQLSKLSDGQLKLTKELKALERKLK